MTATIQFLFTQAPGFWLLLAAFFFALGLLNARSKWRHDRQSFDVATEDQASLLDERDRALATEAAFMHKTSDVMDEVSPLKQVRMGTRGLDRKVKGVFDRAQDSVEPDHGNQPSQGQT